MYSLTSQQPEREGTIVYTPSSSLSLSISFSFRRMEDRGPAQPPGLHLLLQPAASCPPASVSSCRLLLLSRPFDRRSIRRRLEAAAEVDCCWADGCRARSLAAGPVWAPPPPPPQPTIAPTFWHPGIGMPQNRESWSLTENVNFRTIFILCGLKASVRSGSQNP